MKNQYYDLKVRYPDSLVLVKNGSFYTIFNDDAYILNYLFGYKIVNNEKVGFLTSNITKVIVYVNSLLRLKNINFTALITMLI